MARSNKPVIWLPFAAGGTLAAFIMPAVMLLLLLASFGVLPGTLDFERVHAFIAHPLVRLLVFFALALPLWHAAHRLRMTIQDLGLRGLAAKRNLAYTCYLIAATASVLLLFVLWAA